MNRPLCVEIARLLTWAADDRRWPCPGTGAGRAGACLTLAALLTTAAFALTHGEVRAQTFQDQSFYEGNGRYQIQLRVEGPIPNGAVIDWWTADGTAIAGSDYEAASARIVCPEAGNNPCAAQYIYIDILGDTTPEPHETFTVTVAGVGTATITLLNDDADTTPPEIIPILDPPLPTGANGWYVGDVSVSWSVVDLESAPGDLQINFGCSTTTITTDGVTTLSCFAQSRGGARSESVTIRRDTIPPVVTGGATEGPNENGWYKGPVTVDFTCDDAMSGVAGITNDPVTISSEGVDQAVAGECTDAAGNTARATVGDIDIDLTPPSLTGTADPPANAAGWHNFAVTVDFFCTDALSRVADIAGSQHSFIVDREGYRATSVCTDNAGNRAEETVIVNLDRTPPTLTATRTPAPNAAGWNNSPVLVAFNCSDALSGVATSTKATTLAAEGVDQAVAGECTDNAGNSVSTTVRDIDIDLTPPVITATRDPQPNASGWNNTRVDVNFTDCTDALSGVSPGSFAPSGYRFGNAGQGWSITKTCVDRAGNLTRHTVGPINTDFSPPTLTSSVSPEPNRFGWHNGPVTVDFACTDAISDVAEVTSPTTVTSEGRDQSVDGRCVDLAGNVASTTVGNLNIDLTPPVYTVTHRSPEPNAAGWNNTWVSFTLRCTDDLSGTWFHTSGILVTQEGRNLESIYHDEEPLLCLDMAGNIVHAALGSINIDLTPPTLASSVSPSPNAAGWHNTPVTVAFECADTLSGVAGVTNDPTVLATEGVDQAVTAECTDLAGNLVTATEGGIDIDLTPPTATAVADPPANAAGWHNSHNIPVTVNYRCTDELSGVVNWPGDEDGIGIETPFVEFARTCSDAAGNTAVASVVVKIDLTPPVAKGTASPEPNAAGWNNGPVTVDFVCTDGLSGVAEVANDPTTLAGDGTNQSVTGECSDWAGNTAGATVDGINIDLTAPAIVGSASPAPNAAGWNNTPVTVAFSCLDDLSGVSSKDESTTLAEEGPDQAVTGACTDNAGNRASSTIGNINIDLTAPIITGSRTPAPNSAGWHYTPVSVVFACTDNLSTVAAFTPDPATLDAEGADQAVSRDCTDAAGNTAGTTVGNIDIDLTPPVVTASRTPSPNAAGWNNTPVTVAFSCLDNLSGAVEFPDESVTLAAEGAGQSVAGECTDAAGNSATASVDGVNIDLTAPTITGAIDPPLNAAGWSNGPVAIDFVCDDALSGIATCDGDAVVTSEGAAQVVAGSATDIAGNSATATIEGIGVDLTAPSITFLGLQEDGATTAAFAAAISANASGWQAGDVTAAWACDDSDSGPVDATVTATLTSEGAGQSLSGTCADLAGNTASHTVEDLNIDKTAPVYQGVVDLVIQATGPDGAVVDFPFTASDALSGVAEDTCPAQAGLTYPLGTTTVTCDAADRAGNRTSVAFTITVQENPAPTPTATDPAPAPPDPTSTATPSAPTAPTATSTATETTMPTATPDPTATATPTGPTLPTATATETAPPMPSTTPDPNSVPGPAAPSPSPSATAESTVETPHPTAPSGASGEPSIPTAAATSPVAPPPTSTPAATDEPAPQAPGSSTVPGPAAPGAAEPTSTAPGTAKSTPAAPDPTEPAPTGPAPAGPTSAGTIEGPLTTATEIPTAAPLRLPSVGAGGTGGRIVPDLLPVLLVLLAGLAVLVSRRCRRSDVGRS